MLYIYKKTYKMPSFVKISMLFLNLFIANSVFGQELKAIKKIDIAPADTLTYKIIENVNGFKLDVEFKKKINFYRKDEDFIWEPEEGLKILIYKK
jgi:hypothetical protein